MKITQFKLETFFEKNLGKEGISPEQITKLNIFRAKIMWILILVWMYVYLNVKNRKIEKNLNRVLLLIMKSFSLIKIDSKQTFRVGGRRECIMIDKIKYEGRNPKWNKIVEVEEKNCYICGRAKSQNFTKWKLEEQNLEKRKKQTWPLQASGQFSMVWFKLWNIHA